MLAQRLDELSFTTIEARPRMNPLPALEIALDALPRMGAAPCRPVGRRVLERLERASALP
jgi:hypothetical protein